MVNRVEKELRQVEEGDVVQTRGVETSDVVLVPQQQDSRDGTLELGDGCNSLSDGTVEVWIWIAVSLSVKL